MKSIGSPVLIQGLLDILAEMIYASVPRLKMYDCGEAGSRWLLSHIGKILSSCMVNGDWSTQGEVDLTVY